MSQALAVQARVQPRWLNEQEQVTWRTYIAAAKAIQEAIQGQLQRDANIPHIYYEILVRLSEAPDRRLRMSELADRSLSSRSRLSHAVSRLEERGWVVRQACTDDGRGMLAELTNQGLDAITRAAPGHASAVRQQIFDRLTPTQIKQLQEIGEAIIGGPAAF